LRQNDPARRKWTRTQAVAVIREPAAIVVRLADASGWECVRRATLGLTGEASARLVSLEACPTTFRYKIG
jgi:hypothetical protein